MKMKVVTHNNLLKELTNSKWGTNARTIRTPVLALCTIITITHPGLRTEPAMSIDYWMSQSTNVDLYLLFEIATPPDVRRNVSARVERTKQMIEETHYLFGYIPASRHLKSRKYFLTSVQSVHFPPKVVGCNAWQGRLHHKSDETVSHIYTKT